MGEEPANLTQNNADKLFVTLIQKLFIHYMHEVLDLELAKLNVVYNYTPYISLVNYIKFFKVLTKKL